ncbi:MAG: restriction endonuclease subunit S [Erysipelotrichaceae bacterium]|nr:restriction endonuclease subunit S [Erysipelotrichaceae bacterium]
MNGQQLKNSILQMAIQGKLVPQDPNDEPASVLLERIRKEKEKLIKEGKIKKEKNPSYIFRGADNLPYEKVGNNEPVCIADDVPFEIPDSWEWVRLGSIGDWGSGATPSRSIPEYYNGDIPWLKTGDLNDGYIEYIPEKISRFALEKTSVRLNPTGSVLIAMYGATIGKVGILTFPSTTNQACCACLPIEIYNEYLFYFLMSQKTAFIKQGEGGAQPNISKEKIVATLMPLPPLAEQYRIVDKIKKLLLYIEIYGNAQSSLNSLIASFPDLLKKSILQEAIQGKLVPQDPNDEPANVLLKQIREEKQRLIKEGKIKKDKHESIIFKRDNSYYEKLDGIERCIDDELPFEIPDSWEWVRWGTLSESIQYGYNAPAKESGRIKMVRISDIQNNSVILEKVPYCEINENDIDTYLLKPNDILFARTGGTVGKSYLVQDMPEEAIYAGYLIRTRYSNQLNPQYLKYFMESELYWSQLREGTIATAQPNCNGKTLGNMLVPLAPLSEQKRITKQINSLLSSLKTL